MTASVSTSIADSIFTEWMEKPGRPPPRSAQKFCDLKQSFYRLISATHDMSRAYTENSEYVDEFDYQRSLDALTDQLHSICMELSSLRSARRDHLKLKIMALLYLLPEEADAELKLAQSLLADLEERQLDPPASGGQ